jgi:hypothetical protein
MHRRLSSLVNSKNPRDLGDDGSDNESKASTIVRDEPLPVPTLKVKRVDHYYSRWGKTWKYRVRCIVLTPMLFTSPDITATIMQNMSSNVTVETLPVMNGGGSNDAWKDFCFVYEPPVNHVNSI